MKLKKAARKARLRRFVFLVDPPRLFVEPLFFFYSYCQCCIILFQNQFKITHELVKRKFNKAMNEIALMQILSNSKMMYSSDLKILNKLLALSKRCNGFNTKVCP